MKFTIDQQKTEKELEHKYWGVLAYPEAKEFLKGTPYTGSKIAGAIGRFCRQENIERPTTFIEMEPFVNDFVDFWLDANPEIHQTGELKLHKAASNYLAFATVWKAKSTASIIFSPKYMNLTGKMIIAKNALGIGLRLVNSRISHENENGGDANKIENFQQIKDLLPDAVMLSMPIAQGLQTKAISLPKGQKITDLTRLIAAYFNGNTNILSISNTLKLESKKNTKQIGATTVAHGAPH